MRRLTQTVVSVTLVALASCSLPEAPQPRFIIVLVDETGSYLDQGFWQESLEIIAHQVVPALGARDQFLVIGIDDEGFQSEDARLGIETLDISDLKAQLQKRELAERVLQISPRKPARPKTDVFGAIEHAAYFFDAQKDEYRPVLLVFSDLVQTSSRIPTAAKAQASQYRFPPNTFSRLLYVNATGGADYDELRELWIPPLNAIGLEVTEANFFQQSQTVQALAEFPR